MLFTLPYTLIHHLKLNYIDSKLFFISKPQDQIILFLILNNYQLCFPTTDYFILYY